MNPLDEAALRKYCDQANIAKNIVAYSFVTKSLTSYPNVEKAILSPKSFFPRFGAKITGIDENFTKVFFDQYYSPRSFKEGIVYSTLPNGAKDGISPIFDGVSEISLVPLDPNQVYSQQSLNSPQKFAKTLSMKAVIPSAITELTGLDAGNPASVSITFSGNQLVIDMQIINSADKVPGFSFSKYTLSILSDSDILVPMKSYSEIIKQYKQIMLEQGQEAYKKFITWETDEVK